MFIDEPVPELAVSLDLLMVMIPLLFLSNISNIFSVMFNGILNEKTDLYCGILAEFNNRNELFIGIIG